jgi:predicted secreted Zn-dependent protease
MCRLRSALFIGQTLLCASLLALTTRAGAEVSEALSYRYYSGPVESGVPLYDSLKRASPIRFNGRAYLGHTAWQITWRLQWRQDRAGRCRLEQLRTHLKATITLPQKAANDPRARTSFAPFVQALRAHELRHMAIARKAAQAIDERIWQLPTLRTCHELNSAANKVGQRVLGEARQQGVEYDARTGHGRTEGAVLTQ